MYSRIKKRQQQKVKYAVISLTVMLLNSMIAFGLVTYMTSGTTKAEAEVFHQTIPSSDSTVESSVVISIEESSTSSSAVEEISEPILEDPSTVDEPLVEEVVEYSDYDETTYDNAVDTTTSFVTNYQSNGNTAGVVGEEAAAQMAAATGVSQEVWEAIIARESNGDSTVTNSSSGASGLFQTIPGWGSTATVQDQINTAITVYNAQGLSAWGY